MHLLLTFFMRFTEGSNGVISILPGGLKKFKENGSTFFPFLDGFCDPGGCNAVMVKGPLIPKVFCICSSSASESDFFLFLGLSSFVSLLPSSSCLESSPLESLTSSSSSSSMTSSLFCLILGSSVVLPSSSSLSSVSPEFSNSSSSSDLSSCLELIPPSSSLTGLADVKTNTNNKTIIKETAFMFSYSLLGKTKLLFSLMS